MQIFANPRIKISTEMQVFSNKQKWVPTKTDDSTVYKFCDITAPLNFLMNTLLSRILKKKRTEKTKKLTYPQ